MKIALIGPSYPFRGGIAHYTTLLFKNLSKKHQVRFFGFKRQYPQFLFPGESDKEPGKSEFELENIEYSIDSLQPLSWVQTANAIVAYKPDLIILPWWVAFWAPQFFTITRKINQKLGRKVLFICHNVVEHESNLIKQQITQKVLGNGSLFLVHSDQEFTRLRNFFPEAKVARAFMPTFKISKNGLIPQNEARDLLKLNKPTVLFFGFVRKYKGLDLLLKALPNVLNQVDLQLLIVGEFWQDKDEYLQLISSLNLEKNISIVDKYIPNEEVGTYFSAANLLVMPYRSVTGSAVVQLSYSYGLPVLVSKIGALAEIVKDNETGFLVPENDVDAIAEKIIYYFKNNCESSFRNAVEQDKHRFSWDNLVSTIEQLAQNVHDA